MHTLITSVGLLTLNRREEFSSRESACRGHS